MTAQTQPTATSYRSVQPAILEGAGCFGCGADHHTPRTWYKHTTYQGYIVLCDTCRPQMEVNLVGQVTTPDGRVVQMPYQRIDRRPTRARAERHNMAQQQMLRREA